MSTKLPTTNEAFQDTFRSMPIPVSQAAAAAAASKPQRVLACVLCQQRKVKCDRKYPCANCVKSQARCVPATQVSRRRRRRFPERELLERLRRYEELLRRNNIRFEPLHEGPPAAAEKRESRYCGDDGGEEGGEGGGSNDAGDEQPQDDAADRPSPATTIKSERLDDGKSIWHTMSQELRVCGYNSDSSGDEQFETVVKRTLDRSFENNDYLLFGSHESAVNISTLHPEPVQIFRLWQLYLENVDPLLKVTHTPSLQGRIIEAVGNVSNVPPTLEALMFSIYCMSVLSLTATDCRIIFGASKVDLLTRYQFGCQQALLNSRFLQSSDRECLTALYLYLVNLFPGDNHLQLPNYENQVSVAPSTIPRSLSSMLGLAVRIAQRLGIHNEAMLSKCAPLEAEMRRRLWWSLILFDTRIGELAEFKIATATTHWDCRVPLNVNDSDFRPEMKEPPKFHDSPTEALFAAVRSELGDFVRSTLFHLNFAGTASKPGACKDAEQMRSSGEVELDGLERMLEDKYLRFCNPENPLHYMTIWTTKITIAKWRLVNVHAGPPGLVAEAQYDAAMAHGIRVLECDTKIMVSPLTRGFTWLPRCYFPMPAYLVMIQGLRRRPVGDKAGRAWQVMSDNFDAHFGSPLTDEENPFYRLFTRILLQAWAAREAAFVQLEQPLAVPSIVSSIRQFVARMGNSAKSPTASPPDGAADNFAFNDNPMSLPIGLDGHSTPYNTVQLDDFAATLRTAYPDIPGLGQFDIDVNQLNWSAMDWDAVNSVADEAGGTAGQSLSY